MARKISKRLKSARELVESERLYTLDESIELVGKFPPAKFDETVELHVRLGVDPKHADQMVRGTVVLPHGTGKDVRVLVFASGDQEKEALEAGADSIAVIGDLLPEEMTEAALRDRIKAWIQATK